MPLEVGIKAKLSRVSRFHLFRQDVSNLSLQFSDPITDPKCWVPSVEIWKVAVSVSYQQIQQGGQVKGVVPIAHIAITRRSLVLQFKRNTVHVNQKFLQKHCKYDAQGEKKRYLFTTTEPRVWKTTSLFSIWSLSICDQAYFLKTRYQ